MIKILSQSKETQIFEGRKVPCRKTLINVNGVIIKRYYYSWFPNMEGGFVDYSIKVGCITHMGSTIKELFSGINEWEEQFKTA